MPKATGPTVIIQRMADVDGELDILLMGFSKKQKQIVSLNLTSQDLVYLDDQITQIIWDMTYGDKDDNKS
jgi:hypothetical protein